MTISLRATIRGLVAPHHRLSCPRALWEKLLLELARRGERRRESGAFLLGSEHGERRVVEQFVPYDDLEPHCLDSGVVVFDGSGYGPLWALCRQTGRRVVADVHTHPDAASQSRADREHPMVAQPGHLAIIVPRFAQGTILVRELGLYRYRGEHTWDDWSFAAAEQRFYMGLWA